MFFKRILGSILATILVAALSSCASLVGMMKEGKYADALKTIETSNAKPASQEDETGDTALTYAIGKGKIDIVKALVKKGADPEYKSRTGVTPMSSAADAGSLEIVRILFDAGAKPDAVGSKGKTPLSLAFGANDFELAKRMVEKGANVNAAETVKAAYAADMGRLLGKSPDYSFQYVKYLFDKGLKNFDVGYDKSLRLKYNGENTFDDIGMPLISALEYWYSDKSLEKNALLKEVLSRGVSPTFTSTSYKYSALHYAVVKGDIPMTKLILDAWKDKGVNALDFSGRTPVAIAAHDSKKEIFTLLLANGANPKIGVGRESPLFWAWSPDIAKELLKLGVDVNTTCSSVYYGGFTPLLNAVAYARLDLAKLYFENGADPSRIASAECKFNNDVLMPNFNLYEIARTTRKKEIIDWVVGLKSEFAETHARFALADAAVADPVFAKIRDFGFAAVKKDYKGAMAAFNGALDGLKDGDADHDSIAAVAREFEEKARGTETVALLQSGKFEAKDLPGLVKRAQAEKAIAELGRSLYRNEKCAAVLWAAARDGSNVPASKKEYRSPFESVTPPDAKKAAEYAAMTRFASSLSGSDVQRFVKFISECDTLPFVDAEGNDILMFLLRHRPPMGDKSSYQAYFNLITLAKGKADLTVKNKAGKGFQDIVKEYEDSANARSEKLSATTKTSNAGKSIYEKAAEIGYRGQQINLMMYESDMNSGIRNALLK